MSKRKFSIEISDEVFATIEKHCFSRVDVEVGGFLVGTHTDKSATVTHVLTAKHTLENQTQLTFTHKTWDAMYKELESLDGDVKLIGWFHSHPNFGIFLSEYDEFIQTNFFKNDGQVTVVVDPINGKYGWFASFDGKIEPIGEHLDTKTAKLTKPEASSKDAGVMARVPARTENSNSQFAVNTIISILIAVTALLIGANTVASMRNEINDLRLQVQQLQDLIVFQLAPEIDQGGESGAGGSETGSVTSETSSVVD